MFIAIFVTLWMGVIGLLDDYLKLQQKRRGEKNRGFVERYKLAGQVIAGLALGWYLLAVPALAESARRVDDPAVLQVLPRHSAGGLRVGVHTSSGSRSS